MSGALGAVGPPQLLLRVHHVEIHSKRVARLLDLLCSRLDFRPALTHPRGLSHGALVAKGRARFLLRPQPSADAGGPDRVVDVAFETPRLDRFAEHAGGASASASASALRFLSPAGSGLWHTVLQRQQSQQQQQAACFPDLVPVQPAASSAADASDGGGGGAYIDHVALACHASESARILAWYEAIFQLPRYRVNSTETESGFTVRYKDSGMNLKAIASTEEAPPDGRDPRYSGLKFVFAESLNSGPNQINTFLREHGGSGVQHVAIHLDNFVPQVATYRSRGMEFMDPPSAYYTQEIGKVQQIADSGLDLQTVRDNRILVDCEADDSSSEGGGSIGGGDRYLMQVFTKPLLSEETFFLELISRVGARGFGAGNISALWRAVEAHMASMGQL